MKSQHEIVETLEAIRFELPAAVDPARVTVHLERAARGMLRVLLDGNLVGEWGHGVCGWMQCESAQWLGTEGQKVYRAVKRVTR